MNRTAGIVCNAVRGTDPEQVIRVFEQRVDMIRRKTILSGICLPAPSRELAKTTGSCSPNRSVRTVQDRRHRVRRQSIGGGVSFECSLGKPAYPSTKRAGPHGSVATDVDGIHTVLGQTVG